ncbi:MAG: 50S ribosomal protein L22 [Clostridia bacterium]|nr:50S ribosomal protein L22 [Clostridia bacterium]
METKSTQKHIRISPRKVKIVLDLIRGKDVGAAVGILKNTRKAASPEVLKLLNKVAADAENNFQMNRDTLYVSECYVCPGMTLKRIMPRGKGSADRILKRTSHITIAVAEKE